MDLLSSSLLALSENMAIQKDEKIFVIFDETTVEIADALTKAADELNICAESEKITLTGGHGVEPPVYIAEKMLQFPVIMAPTFYSLTHTDSVRKAVDNGCRVATLPGINNEIFLQGLASDPAQLKIDGDQWCLLLQNASNVKVTTQKGTDLTFSVKKYKPMNDDALINKPGIYGNLPGGEAFIAPDEGSANGTIVFDGTIGGQEGSDIYSSVILTLKDGYIIDFGLDKTDEQGRIRAEKLKNTLTPYGHEAFLLAEFGIGTNKTLKMTGNLLGDEKLAGTIHFAFGNNCGMGGKNNVKVHIDCLVTKPEIHIF
jgi:leucyl aminopeptidase (aminopeptidase T)